ncbi:hypothetical protein BU15DRAFT_77716 [Melanogaster broomeanus]|nr:hypothetical protein BU15DRAFT_77716 [Melanogaster broomeanus]
MSPSPLGRPSRRAKTAHKYIKPKQYKDTRSGKQLRAKAAPVMELSEDHMKSPPAGAPCNEELSQIDPFEKESEPEEDSGETSEVNRQPPSNQVGETQDTQPRVTEEVLSHDDGVDVGPARARTTGITLRRQAQKCYPVEDAECEDDDEFSNGEPDDDADWEPPNQDALKQAHRPTKSQSKVSTVEKQMARFHQRLLLQTVTDTPNTLPQSPADEPLWFLPSDDEVVDQPDGTDDEDDRHSNGASKAKGKRVHRPGPLPDEACQKAHELGDSVMKALQELAVEYGKPVERILEEAGLKKLATRAEQRWNLHQKWYAFCHPITEGESVKDYRLRQKDHYATHGDEEEHTTLWQEIREHARAIIREGELSAKSLAALIEEAREQFAKGASAWSRLEGVEVIGMVVYKGHDSVARHAAGWFGGSTFVRDLINTHELQLAKWLDYVTTVVKYKEIDSSATVPIPDVCIDGNVGDDVSNVDQEFERGTVEGFRDWNRRIVPIMMGKKLKQFGCTDGKNIPWQSFDDLLYRHKLTVTNWPAGVAAPPTWVPHDATIDELIAVVGPYLKQHLPSLHLRHIVPNAGKRRLAKVKNRQPRLTIPDVEVSVSTWMPEWCRWLDNNDPRMFTILLITDTESQPLCILRQCRKFLRDVPREVSIPPEQQSSQSSPSREPSPVVARKKAKDRVKQPHCDQIGTLPVRASKSNLQSRKRRHDEESLDEHHVRKHMKLESRVKDARNQQVHWQLQSDAQGAEMPRHHVPRHHVLPQQRAERLVGKSYYHSGGLMNMNYDEATRPADFSQPPLPSRRVPAGHGATQTEVPVVRSRHHEVPQRQALARPPPSQAMGRSRSPSYVRRSHVLRNASPVAGPSRSRYLEVGSGDEYEDLSEIAQPNYYDSYYD